MSQEPDIQEFKSIFIPWIGIVGLVLLCLLPSFLGLFALDFGVQDIGHGEDIHTILETSAVLLALFASLLALLHYAISRDMAALLIGGSLLTAGCLDLFHILVSDRLLFSAHSVPNFVIFTGATSRMGAILVKMVGAGLFIVGPMLKAKARMQSRKPVYITAAILLAATAAIVIGFTLNVRDLPSMLRPTALIHRPWDIPPLLASLLAGLVIYPLFYKRHPGLFAQTIWLSAIPEVTTQLHMVFGSARLFDNHYMIAHVLRLITYALPLCGLILDYFLGSRVIEQLRHAQSRARESVDQLHATGMALDSEIDARKKVETSLRSQEEYFRIMMEHISDIVIVLSRTGVIRYISPSVQRHLAYKVSEVQGQPVFKYAHPLDLPKLTKVLMTALRNPRVTYNITIRTRAKNGDWHDLEAVGFAWTNAQGESLAIVNCRDMTARHRTEEQLHLLQRAIESASDGITVVDARAPDTPLLYVNPSFEKMTGYTKEEVLGKNPRILQGQDRDQLARHILRQAVDSGKPASVTLKNYRKDGTLFWNDLRITPIRDAAGTLTHWVGIKTDITLRRQAEENMYRYEEQLRLLLDSVAEGVFGTDMTGICTFANLACMRMLGYHRVADLIGQSMHAAVHHSQADGSLIPEEECRLHGAIRTGQPWHSDDQVYWRRDGTCFPVEAWSHPIIQEGQTIGAVVSFVDISERKQLQSMLHQSEKLSAVGKLAAGMAHELNNPLTGILGFAQILLQDASLSPQQRRDIETILTQSRRCSRIIKNLLSFSYRHPHKKEAVDLNAVFKTVIDLVDYEWTTSGFTLEIKCPEPLPPIHGDPEQLSQVFLNLVTNARHAMEESPRKTLTITGTVETDKVCLRFHDSGSGIPPDILTKIFDPFFTTKPVGKGTGLGLSICYGIIQDHQGQIAVESHGGTGTTVTVTLPLAKSR